MNAHSPIVVEKFYDLCNRAYRDWRIHKIIFVENPRKKELETSVAGLVHFSILSQESILLQIAKLHDPAIQQGHITLGVEYMVRFGGWDEITGKKLEGLKGQLDGLANKIRPARHKILSHNDLETILSEATLGEFPDGEDDHYFKTLQEFVDVIHSSVIGGPVQFSGDAGRVANELLWFFGEKACKDKPTFI
jgi:hypothetical protein